jgi:imidazolonepropionase-like amidohydrolase
MFKTAHINRCLCAAVLWLILLPAAQFVFGTEESEPQEQESFAFVHVNVIPMDRERVLPNQTVIVRDGRISKIGPFSSTSVSAKATMIDASGKYLIPALSDMHVHMLGEGWNVMFPPEAQFSAEDLDFNRLLIPYIANGVATVQVMSALPEHITLRDQISRGEILGPRLILARMIDGPGQAWPPPLSTWVETADSARQAVLDAKEAGYDKIKVYSFLNKESYDSIILTANEVGMPVDGHIPMALSVEYILEAGQNLIAHAEEVMKHTGGNYDEETIDYFTEIIAGSGTTVIPTLIMKKNLLAILDDFDKELARPEIQYLHPMAMGVISFLTSNIYLKMPPEKRTSLRNGYELFEKPFIKALHDKGAKLIAGTDALVPITVPGFSIHRELEELVDVGLTPFEALRTSTTSPFEFLGELHEAGTIETGKRADLVLLGANPLEKITNSREIEGVMIGGRWISKIEIKNRLEELPVFYETLKR